MSKFSVKEAIGFGWGEFKAQWKILVPVWVTVIVVNLGLSAWQENINQALWWAVSLVALLSAAFSLVATLGTTKISLLIARGERANYMEVFAQWRLVLKYLAAQIVVGLITLVGFILLIIPGVIFATRLQFVVYALVDKNMGVLEAVRYSWKITSGQVWRLMVFGFAVTLVILLGLLALGIGVVVAVGVTTVASAHVYDQLSK